jgi:hypothetical protein
MSGLRKNEKLIFVENGMFILIKWSTTMLRVQATFRKNDPSENHEIFSLQVVKSSIEYGTFLMFILIK